MVQELVHSQCQTYATVQHALNGSHCLSPNTQENSHVYAGKYIGGILLAFFGSTLESIGATIQKYAADTEDRTAKADGREPTAYIKLKWFWVGTIVFIAGNGLDFAALAMVPAAVVVCVGSWALILNLFTASKILGEERTSSDYVAACLIIVGIVLAMSGRPIVDTVWTMEVRFVTFTQSRHNSWVHACCFAFLKGLL